MSAIAQLEQQLAGQQQVLLAYSGGLDSTVLLHQLVQLRVRMPALQLRALHVHHGLSPFADVWVTHCQQQCALWQVPLCVEHVQFDTAGKGVEAAAREARYQVFHHHVQPGEMLLTAQHLDDQCETLLLALKRGSGPAGLSAMPAKMAFGPTYLLRPLLQQRRQQLEAWAAEHQLQWIEDESNRDTRYERNFLRQQVLPLLNTRWPHFAQASARSALLCGEQEQLLDELLAESLAQCLQADGALRIDQFAAMSAARRAALLHRWIASQGGKMPSRDALQRLYDEVIASRRDAVPRLQFGCHEIRRYRQALYWLAVMPSLRQLILPWPVPAQPLSLPGDLGQLIQDPHGIALRLPRHDEPVNIRFQAQGDVHIVGRDRGRSIKKLWQELAIPPWQRERTPMIFYGEHLIAVPGLFVTRDGDAGQRESWRVSWQKQC